MRLVVLAAGQGSRLRPLTDDRPKALIPFLGRPILDWTMVAARENDLTDITVVGGYKSGGLESYPVHLLRNPDFATTSMVGTMMAAEQYFTDAFVASYGDIVYRPELLRALLASPADVSVVVDLDWLTYWERRFGDPLSNAESLRMNPDGAIRSIGQTVNRIEDVQAQFVGLVAFRGRGVKALKRAWARATTDAAYRRPILGHRLSMAKLGLTDVLDELAVGGDVVVKAVPVHGGWVDIDTPEDIVAAEERWNASRASEFVPAASGPTPPAAANSSGSSGTTTVEYDNQPRFHPVRRW
jgi:L-glutamine-phosphate cytidylyltransferase